MNTDQSRIDDLIGRLSESLTVEVKRWIRIDEPNGISKIVRGALALRNRNGGYFVVGFDDKTLQPDVGNEPSDVRAAFHTDKVQGLISRYASELFEVRVVFGKLGAREYPVIIVPDGVRSPVAAKANLQDQKNTLIRFGEVYFRTLSANGTPSTAPARPQDWPEIVEICFNNREADFGRFLRRQLAGHDIASLFSAVSDLRLGQNSAPNLKDRAITLLQNGRQRLDLALAERKLTKDEQAIIHRGSWEAALIIDPAQSDRIPNDVFLRTLASSNPQYTGWPIWLDSRSFSDQRSAPVVRDKGWEALIISLGDDVLSKYADFLRFDPKGEFYLWRILQDDVSDKIPPGKALDPILAILRVTETLLVGLAFAKVLGWNSEEARLGFAFRWTKLKGRQLEPWANPVIPISSHGTAQDDTVTTFVELTLDTPESAVAPYVDQATRELFVLFGGYSFPTATTEHWVRRLVERKLW
jgi:hypothetical protein